MKKLFFLIFSIIFALSLCTAVFAVGQGSIGVGSATTGAVSAVGTDSGDVMLDYTCTITTEYAVDITWGNLNFVLSDIYDWNTETLNYFVLSSGWRTVGTGNNKVTVKNRSSRSVSALVSIGASGVAGVSAKVNTGDGTPGSSATAVVGTKAPDYIGNPEVVYTTLTTQNPDFTEFTVSVEGSPSNPSSVVGGTTLALVSVNIS